MTRCEARVAKLEEMREAIDARLANPILYARSSQQEMEALQKKRAEILDGLDRAEALWVAAVERLDAASERV